MSSGTGMKVKKMVTGKKIIQPNFSISYLTNCIRMALNGYEGPYHGNTGR